MSYNGKTLLWLLLCFPVGLTRMWRSRCSWHYGVKYALSSLVVIALAAALIYPSPSVGAEGGIVLYGEDPSAEVYGPKIPENYIFTGNTAAVGSVIVPEEDLVDNRFFVYAGEKAKCYHLSSCDYAYDSAKKLTIYEAHYSGYIPCNICNPPPYDGTF